MESGWNLRRILPCALVLVCLTFTGCVGPYGWSGTYTAIGHKLDTFIQQAEHGQLELKYLDNPFRIRMAIYVGLLPYSPGILPLSHGYQFSCDELIELELLREVLDEEGLSDHVFELFAQDVSAFFSAAWSVVFRDDFDHPIYHIAEETQHTKVEERTLNRISSELVETIDEFHLVLDDVLVANVFYETLWRKADDWKLNTVSITYALDPEFLETVDWESYQ